MRLCTWIWPSTWQHVDESPSEPQRAPVCLLSFFYFQNFHFDFSLIFRNGLLIIIQQIFNIVKCHVFTNLFKVYSSNLLIECLKKGQMQFCLSWNQPMGFCPYLSALLSFALRFVCESSECPLTIWQIFWKFVTNSYESIKVKIR